MYQQFGRGKRFLGCAGGYRRSRIGRIGGGGVKINERGDQEDQEGSMVSKIKKGVRNRRSMMAGGKIKKRGREESKINDGGR